MQYIIRNALVFNGNGTAPVQQDVAVCDGKVFAMGQSLQLDGAEVIDGTGKWLMPGLLDIHTHLDLEVEINPCLHEAVRHGTTTVLVGNCSLGTAFGAQERNGEQPIIDCFTRVENMPKPVLQKCVDKMYWHNTADYMSHFDDIPLGPNIAPFIPHSMLRVEVMGVDGATSRQPTDEEKAKIRELMRKAMDEGYLGLSTDQIVVHYLSNDPNKEKRIPTQFAEDPELREAIEICREYDRVWQTNPAGDRMGRTIKRFFWTSGRLFKKPLRVSALTAVDFVHTPGVWKAMLNLAKILNSWLFKGHFHFQALGTNFRIWSNGVVSPVFEELDSTRKVVACEAEDYEGRQKIINDPEWQTAFKQDWKRVQATEESKSTFKFLSRKEDQATFLMNFDRMFFDACAVENWNGESLSQVQTRLIEWQASGNGARSDAEKKAFEGFSAGCEDEAQFFLQGLIQFDTEFRWWFDSANANEDVVEKILFDKNALPGFNDSGAHITNLAFYDANLNTLRIAQKSGVDKVATAVRRLTKEPAEFFGLDTGEIAVGKQADLVLVNPEQLKHHDCNKSRTRIYNELFEHEILVNRANGVVDQVYIAGERVWQNASEFTEVLGSKKLGSALKVTRTAA